MLSVDRWIVHSGRSGPGRCDPPGGGSTDRLVASERIPDDRANLAAELRGGLPCGDSTVGREPEQCGDQVERRRRRPRSQALDQRRRLDPTTTMGRQCDAPPDAPGRNILGGLARASRQEGSGTRIEPAVAGIRRDDLAGRPREQQGGGVGPGVEAVERAAIATG
jgi:hypothetical protein